MELTLNLSGLRPDVAQSLIKGLKHEDKAQHDLGVIEQVKLKQFMDTAMQPGANTNIGRACLVMSEGQRLAAMRLHGQRCFQDPDFSAWLAKNNPEFRVKDVGTKIVSGWTPQSQS
jgi:hypothetical protein